MADSASQPALSLHEVKGVVTKFMRMLFPLEFRKGEKDIQKQLPDRSGLAHPVDTHHHDDGGRLSHLGNGSLGRFQHFLFDVRGNPDAFITVKGWQPESVEAGLKSNR